MNIDCYYRRMFLNRGLQGPSRSAVPHCSAKKPIPTNGDTSANKQIFKPILPNDRTTKEWTAIAWPTNIQSGTPDGKFGPAKMMEGWGDCWFLAIMAAVANNPDGHKILNQSIKKVNGGYEVTFKGSQNNNVFISDSELNKCLDNNGGDADTRLMELAAERFFNGRGNFESLFIAAFMRRGLNQDQAEGCLEKFCSIASVQDRKAYNPMRNTGEDILAYFMVTGLCPDTLFSLSSISLQDSDIMAYLNQYVANERDGASIAIGGIENPLGESADSQALAIYWDVIRTEITCDERFRRQKRAFLKILDKYLASGSPRDLQALTFVADNLNLEHINLLNFVKILAQNLFHLKPEHTNLLRSGVQEVLSGGYGYIGFTGRHFGTIEGINEAAGTFTYSEPNNPTLVHTGELSGLIQAIRSGKVRLSALKPPSEQNNRESFEHAGTSRGRHLRQIHNQVVRDGKIDQAESAPLADLMEMDDGAFWQVYDSDKNGVIKSGELKAVKLQVDRWVDHLELTPIL